MDTFELLPSLAQGELAATSAPELVAAVFRSRASGTLWLETQDGSEIRLFFRAGEMGGTAPFSGFQTLAQILLVNDWVNALDIDASRSEAEAGRKRHGEVLVARRLLTPEQLRSALAEQHRRNLSAVLAMTAGRYDWRGWEPPPPWAREVAIDPVGCIVEALALEPAAPRRKRVVDWLGENPARLSVDWPELQGRIALQPVDRRAAALLALPRRLPEFVQASRLPQVRAEALLVALLLAGGVEPQPGGAPAAPPPEPKPEEKMEQLPLDASSELLPVPEPEELPVPEPEELPAFVPVEEPEEPHLAQALAEPLETPPAVTPLESDPLSEMDVAEPPPPRRVSEQEAFARLDSLFLDEPRRPTSESQRVQASPHDDLDLSLDEPPARAPGPFDGRPDEPPPGIEAPALRPEDPRGREVRKKLLQQGLRNLGAAPRESQPEVAPAQPPAPAQLDAGALTSEERRFVDDLRARLRAAPSQTAYARLGQTPQASNEQLKTAYIQAAKRFHPDRASASPALGAVQGDLEALFSSMKEAYDLVATPEARARYDATLQASATASKPVSRKEEAAAALKQGDTLVKKRDFEAGLQKLRRAVELDATADALAALAWGLICDPKQPASAKEEAAGLVNRALRAPGPTARTYYVAGVIWRTKDPDSSVDAFRKALELEPSHPDASLELRLLESRRGKAQKSGSGVLSGLLFGKRK